MCIIDITTMTTTSICITDLLSRLQGMPGILQHIFEYDDTYKQIFQKQILPSIWQSSWLYKYEATMCPYKAAILGFLMGKWGVFQLVPETYWFRRHNFTDNYKIIVHDVDVDEDTIYATAYMNYNGALFTVFVGKVLTQKQHKMENLKETGNFIQYIDVYEDVNTGMVVYTNTISY